MLLLNEDLTTVLHTITFICHCAACVVYVCARYLLYVYICAGALRFLGSTMTCKNEALVLSSKGDLHFVERRTKYVVTPRG